MTLDISAGSAAEEGRRNSQRIVDTLSFGSTIRVMREVGANLGIPVFVFGPETHMTAVVGMALGKRAIPRETTVEFSTANFLLPGGQEDDVSFP